MAGMKRILKIPIKKLKRPPRTNLPLKWFPQVKPQKQKQRISVKRLTLLNRQLKNHDVAGDVIKNHLPLEIVQRLDLWKMKSNRPVVFHFALIRTRNRGRETYKGVCGYLHERATKWQSERRRVHSLIV